MRVVAVLMGIFFLFLAVAQMRLGGANCAMVADHSERGVCLAKEIEIRTTARPEAERLAQYETASEGIPDNYLLVLRVAETYAASGDTSDALPLFDRAEHLIRQENPVIANRIVEEKNAVLRASGTSK